MFFGSKKRAYLFFLLIFGLPCKAVEPIKQLKVGLLIVATGKYIQFVEPLIESADKYFCTNHDVTYFVFTEGDVPKRDDVIKIQQHRLGWPHDTMMRPVMYYECRDILSSMDYLFACDADMLFVGDVGDEILSDLVGALHPGYFGSKGTPEYRRASTAYIPRRRNKYYFAGGFNGGKTEHFIKMVGVMTKNILKDLERGIIALWHDESHLNKYFFEHSPTKILTPSYCYAEQHPHKIPKKLIALDKNHSELRK